MDTTSLTACSPFAGAKFRQNIQIKKLLHDAALSMLWSSLRVESEMMGRTVGEDVRMKKYAVEITFSFIAYVPFRYKGCGVPHLKVAKLWNAVLHLTGPRNVAREVRPRKI